jgi:hypothetical protein
MTRTARTARTAIVAAALMLASCGGAELEAATSTNGAAASTTVAAEVDTTETTATPTTTTSQPLTTTTTAPTTTTTATSGGKAGVSSEAYQALTARVQQAGEPTSARMEGTMQIVGSAEGFGADEITLPFSLAFDDAGNSSFSMDMSGMADAIAEEDDPMGFGAMFGAMEVRTIGETAYLKFGFFTMMMGAETEWVSMPAEEGAGFEADMQDSLPSDPSDLLEGYESANAEVTDLGRQTVNGVETDHYLITIDAAAFLEELSPSERAELEASGPVPNADLPIELWISDEGHVVRMLMEIDGTAIDHASPEEAFERMTFTFDVFDINQPITIEAPPADQVTAIDDIEGAFDFGGDLPTP